MLSHWLLWSCGGEAPGPADSYFASSRITPSTTELPGSPGASERVCVSVCVCVGGGHSWPGPAGLNVDEMCKAA